MSEEDPESSTPEKDINSESLSHQSAHSLEDEEDQPDEYTNYQQNQDISDKNEEEIIENENNEIKDPNILGENDNKYIAMIEGLEDELYIEQYITKSLKKDPDFNEEVNKLKNELVNKNNKLEQLKLINKKQENTLIEFRAKLKKEKTMNNKVIINNGTNDKLNNNINLREVSKNEAMNNAIKNKDSDLTNVLNKMNLLKKENEDLKKKIYQIENNYNSIHNNNSNQNYEDNTQKNLEKIKFLQTEKRLIEKQLIEHNKCIEEQNLINKEYNNLKNELRLLKINNQEIKTKIKEFEKKILNIEINDINNMNIINSNNITNLIHKKKNKNNISNRRTPSIRNTTFSKTLPKVQNKNLLPIISIQPLIQNISNYSNNNSNNKSILSEEFLKKIKNYFNENENDYFNLIEKINNIENYNINFDSNYTQLKKFNTQVGILDKINLLNLDGKENEGGIKIMNHKLNLLKDENIQQNKKIEELNKHLDNIKHIEKEKDNEINALLNKINSMKNTLKLDNK